MKHIKINKKINILKFTFRTLMSYKHSINTLKGINNRQKGDFGD